MNLRTTVPAVALAGLIAVTATGYGDDNTAADDGSTSDDLRTHTVTALDFPRSVFDGWEITDPAEWPTDVIPAIALAAGTSDSWDVTPAACAPTGDRGAALWSAVRGTGDWAGQVGENSATGQSFAATIAGLDPAGLNAATEFATQCASYTVTAGGRTIAVTTEATNAEPLRYGLSDARLFTTTATVDGQPESTFSTLTGVGQHDGRVLAGQFTTPGKIEGPVINVAGNWWNILARKAVNGQQQQ
ncbi:hypothetical protein [Prescottella agglutinans]|uniref:FlaG/FlaF family flagellin (Archaellin) n=1 Tax=Prescottella agglutinans TaxID=1644129 RepID=A0ABT6MK54_9NOCA|nr:hypothetical protein [Prescottella agglutinans]MDH6284285.1 FlaG/FlaF family flagellin (archaellin) [Prescottella agglutinans]